MRKLPREPIPGHDRVAVRVPEHHTSPVYRPGQRIADQPEHGQITRDPAKHEVFLWTGLIYDLYREGALELVGLLQPGPCRGCAEIPWRTEHVGVKGLAPAAGGGPAAALHHPDCPELARAAVEPPPAAPTPAPPAAGERAAPALADRVVVETETRDGVVHVPADPVVTPAPAPPPAPAAEGQPATPSTTEES